MACNHKFQSELTIEGLNYKPSTLIVGTFNPEWPESNYAEWFYGRTKNNYFWDLLPRIFGDAPLRSRNHIEWKKYCQLKQIALTDLIIRIDDAYDIEIHRNILSRFTDSDLVNHFRKHLYNPIADILKANPSIESVYLTTTSDLWINVWSPVEQYCNQNGLWCKKLMTPSKSARFFMTKGSGIKLPDFIYEDWEDKWNHKILKGI